MKSKHNKGFTLVELIVVLVILAILAALLIPALTGYIDKSRKSQVIAETRMLHSAIQTEVSECYGTSAFSSLTSVDSGTYTTRHLAAKTGTTAQQAAYNDILNLAEVPSLSGNGEFGAYFTEDGKVAVIMYKNGKGEIGIYFGDTGETIAYDEDDFRTFDDYFSGIRGYVTYTPRIQAPPSADYPDGFPNYLILKEYILNYFTGYKKASTT